MHLPEYLASYWKHSGGNLHAGGLNLPAIAQRHGTPVFIYDQGILQQKYAALRAALPRRFRISYSVKANPNPAFLQFFLDKQCGLEIASAGEFHLALGAGCLPENVVFAGPGKSEAELELVIAGAIGEIHAESSLEIDRISSISRRLGMRTPMAVRVNPNEDGQGGAMRMGGKSAPFGIDEELLEPVLDLIVNRQQLDLRGIHLFVGTQILDHKLLLAQYRKGLDIARRVAARTGAAIHTLDFGGGLGIPYFHGDTELDLGALSEGLRLMLDEISGEGCFAATSFMVEPGRFLVGESGVYVARINDVKISRGKKFLILDGGMNHHLAASGNLGQVIKRNFPMALVNKLDLPATETVDVVGPLCTPLDTVGRSVLLPAAEVGDLVGIFQSGAYARTSSPLGFLSHATPPEVWIEHGQDFLIRRRGSSEDGTRDVQLLPNFQPHPTVA